MLFLQLPAPAASPFRILCLGSHSDDIEIGCGGTILRLLSQNPNCEVTWVVFSSTKEREQEARSSAEMFLGRAAEKHVIVNDCRDGFFPYDGASVKQSMEGLKSTNPQLILTHNRRDSHQDHRVIAELTWNTFRDHFILEYEIPKYDGDMGQPSVFVPLEEDIYQRKVRHLMDAFATQRNKRWFQPETFLALMRLRGMECNSPSGYAEAFYCRKLVL
jgi:LmbE family N-acetylglucosaminyl deacetylase